MIIDTRGDFYHGQKARKIWKALYKLANAHEFRDLDNFLIDLRVFEEFLAERKTHFWWTFSPGGWTWVHEENPYEENCYEILVEPQTITITEASRHALSGP